MKLKIIALLVVTFTFGNLILTHGILLNHLATSEPLARNSETLGLTHNSLNNLNSLNSISSYDPSRIVWANAQALTVNTQLDISSTASYPVDNQNNYPIFQFTLTKGYYLNLTVFQAIWASLNNDPQGTGNLTSYYLDIDVSIFFSNHTAWINGTSNNYNEIVTSQIPLSGVYYVILYPFINNILTYGSQISTVLFDVAKNHFNTTIYGGSAVNIPHANLIRVQMVDQGYALYGNNLDLTKALTYNVLPHLPDLKSGLSTWLWEYDKFGLPINDLYKVFVPKNTSLSVNVTYGGTQTSTRITNTSKVLTVINYNDYLAYLNGSINVKFESNYSNSVKTFPLNGTTLLLSSNVTNFKSDSDTYFIISLNNILLNDAKTFPYTLSIDFSDYIDNTHSNNNRASAVDISNILANYTLYTSKFDADFFSLHTTTPPMRLTINLFFDRNYGQINLYLFNKTIETSNNETLSLVGKSTFSDQNQQSIVYNLFDNYNYYIKVNSTASYSNSYQLNITIGSIDDKYEPNDNIFQSAILYNPGTYDLYLAKHNEDFFKVFLFNGDQLNATIRFTGSLGDLNIQIKAPDTNTILATSEHSSGNLESVAITTTQNGYYYIRIYGNPVTFLKPGLDYNLTIDLIPLDDYLEPNNDYNHAVPIQDGFFQLISRAGNEDWFNFYMRKNDFMTISVTFDTSKGDIDIFMYNRAFTILFNSSQSFSNNESFSFTAPYEGEFLIRVALFDGLSVNYNMNITLTDERYDIYEDNDNFNQAHSMNPGYYTGIIAQGGDHDFFKVSIPLGYAMIVELKEEIPNTGKFFRLSLYNSHEGELNNSERNLNSQIASIKSIESATTVYIESYYKGFDKVTYTLNITIGLSSTLFPPPNINFATIIPNFSGYANSSTVVLPPLYNFGTLLAIGVIGLGGGAAAGIGGTVFSQKFELGSKIKNRIKK